MARALAIAAILLALGGAYLVYKNVSRSSEVSISPSPAEEVHITTATVAEEAETYVIDAKYPQFGIPAIDGKIKETIDLSIAQFKKDALEAPPVPESAVDQYEFLSIFDSVYAGPDVVSVRLVLSTYMGGAHGISIVNGLNFERNTGRELTLSDALRMAGLSLEEVAEKAKAELQAKLRSDIIAPEGADPTPENYSTFSIDADSVTFIFQVYQVAPYSAGPQEVSFERRN